MGLSLASFMTDVGSTFSRKAFKPASHFAADPVPALTGQAMSRIPAFKPGSGAPDPVPATPANDVVQPSFKTPVTLNEDGSMSWMEVGPVPATNGRY